MVDSVSRGAEQRHKNAIIANGRVQVVRAWLARQIIRIVVSVRTMIARMLLWASSVLKAVWHRWQVVGPWMARKVMRVVTVQVLHWINIALHALWHGLRVIGSLLKRGFTALFRILQIGLIWTLDHLATS